MTYEIFTTLLKVYFSAGVVFMILNFPAIPMLVRLSLEYNSEGGEEKIPSWAILVIVLFLMTVTPLLVWPKYLVYSRLWFFVSPNLKKTEQYIREQAGKEESI